MCIQAGPIVGPGPRAVPEMSFMMAFVAGPLHGVLWEAHHVCNASAPGLRIENITPPPPCASTALSKHQDPV